MKPAKKKLRIVWICHFMNQPIQKKMGFDGKEREMAPWISLGIEEMKKREDIELYVIAPFIKILRNYHFNDGNIHYYCVKVGIPFWRRDWPRRFKFNVWSGFYFFNIQVRKIIKKINPHLINLQGAENAYYSSSILGIKGYPILVTIQGFISLDKRIEITPWEKIRLQVEKKILCRFKYFGIEATSVENYIRTLNPDAKMYRFHYPMAKSNVRINEPKKYDLVYFARITKIKGIEDLVRAVSIVKDQIPEISLCIIGQGDDPYFEYLKNLIDELNIGDNIIFKGFFPTQIDMHHEVAKARISVLPTYNDTIPGTIVESMLMGIPVISYKTGGIPDLNKEGEHVILVEQGNIQKLADEISELLGNIDRQKELADKARKYASLEFDNANSVNLMIQAYRDIIKKFRNEN